MAFVKYRWQLSPLFFDVRMNGQFCNYIYSLHQSIHDIVPYQDIIIDDHQYDAQLHYLSTFVQSIVSYYSIMQMQSMHYRIDWNEDNREQIYPNCRYHQPIIRFIQFCHANTNIYMTFFGGLCWSMKNGWITSVKSSRLSNWPLFTIFSSMLKNLSIIFSSSANVSLFWKQPQ